MIKLNLDITLLLLTKEKTVNIHKDHTLDKAKIDILKVKNIKIIWKIY